jgi:hypothetical protein
MYGILLSIHITAGFTALSSAAVAVATPKGERRHVYSGRAFVIGMAVVFLTALPMTVMKPNLFLLLIAIFSFYLTVSGWLRARNRSGIPTAAEWIAAIAMVLGAVAMGGRGIAMLAVGLSMGTVLLVFGGIGGLLAVRDLMSLRAHRYRGNVRIAAHVGRMLGGTIAAVTAFAVVNVRMEPAFIVWLAPTVVLTPLIVYWVARVRRGTGSAPDR